MIKAYAILDEGLNVYDIRFFDSDKLPVYKEGRVLPLEEGTKPLFDPEIERLTFDAYQVIAGDKVVKNYTVVPLLQKEIDRIVSLKSTIQVTDTEAKKVTLTLQELVTLLGF